MKREGINSLAILHEADKKKNTSQMSAVFLLVQLEFGHPQIVQCDNRDEGKRV